MRKSILILLICLSVLLTACGSKSAIQEATGANSKQNVVITEALESVGIHYEMINEANHNKPDIILADDCKIYNVIDRDAVNYFLILDADYAVVAILDSEAVILSGSIT